VVYYIRPLNSTAKTYINSVQNVKICCIQCIRK